MWTWRKGKRLAVSAVLVLDFPWAIRVPWPWGAGGRAAAVATSATAAASRYSAAASAAASAATTCEWVAPCQHGLADVGGSFEFGEYGDDGGLRFREIAFALIDSHSIIEFGPDQGTKVAHGSDQFGGESCVATGISGR